MRIDYQRITEEMYAPRQDREPRSNRMLLVGFILITVLILGSSLYVAGAILSLWHELQGF